MYPSAPWRAFLPWFAAAAVLAGCTTSVSYVVNNETAYAARFLPSELPEAVAGRFSPSSEPPWGFNEMALSVVSLDPANKRFAVSRVVMENLGGGLVRTVAEETQSGIPSTRYFGLSYRGFLPLRWNEVRLYEQIEHPLTEIMEFGRFDPVTAAALPDQLEYHYRQRGAGELRSTTRSMICKSGLEYPARRLYPTLDGDAVELGCEVHGQLGDIVQKDMWAYLLHYGVGLKIFSERSNKLVGYRIQSLSIEPLAPRGASSGD